MYGNPAGLKPIAGFNYLEVDLEDDLEGYPVDGFLSGKFIKTLLKLV